jgi:hypothetical protein
MDDELPPWPSRPGDREAALTAYYRRRADQAIDRRLSTLEATVDRIDGKVDGLATRQAQLAILGGVALTVASIVGPAIAAYVLGQL